MAFVIYDIHITHFHMDPAQSVAWLGVTSQMKYLEAHCWIWATLLHPTIITLVGAPNVYRYVQIFKRVIGYMWNGAPCYCIIIILHSLFPLVTTTFPLPWLVFVIMLLSTDTTHTNTVRWVFGCCCSSLLSSLWGLWLTHPDLVLITCGLLSCLFCGTLSLFVPVLSSNLGILGLFTPALSCCWSTLILALLLLLSSLHPLLLICLKYVTWFMYMCMYGL